MYIKSQIIIVLFILVFDPILKGQNLQNKLNTADKLYKQKQFTESFELYQEILNENKYTPQMLLKMAFIKEGLDQYAEALYYLDLYYQITYEKKILQKMEEIARAHNLVGYAYNDISFFENTFMLYGDIITVTLLGVCFLFFLGFIYHYRRTKQIIHYSLLFMLLGILIVGYLNNFFGYNDYAIISKPQTFIMSGPSSGAEVVDIVDKGHKVKVLGNQSIWTAIQWQGNRYFVRNDKLKKLI